MAFHGELRRGWQSNYRRCDLCGSPIPSGTRLCAGCEKAEASQWDYEGSGAPVIAAHGDQWSPEDWRLGGSAGAIKAAAQGLSYIGQRVPKRRDTAAETARRLRSCVICQAPVEGNGNRVTCSEFCRKVRQARQVLKSYHRRNGYVPVSEKDAA